jgi:hypothetical protein
MRVCLTSTSYLWARNNLRDILVIGYTIGLSVRVWTGIVEDVIVGPYLMPGRFTVQRYCVFLENVLSGCFKMCL